MCQKFNLIILMVMVTALYADAGPPKFLVPPNRFVDEDTAIIVLDQGYPVTRLQPALNAMTIRFKGQFNYDSAYTFESLIVSARYVSATGGFRQGQVLSIDSIESMGNPPTFTFTMSNCAIPLPWECVTYEARITVRDKNDEIVSLRRGLVPLTDKKEAIAANDVKER